MKNNYAWVVEIVDSESERTLDVKLFASEDKANEFIVPDGRYLVIYERQVE